MFQAAGAAVSPVAARSGRELLADRRRPRKLTDAVRVTMSASAR